MEVDKTEFSIDPLGKTESSQGLEGEVTIEEEEEKNARIRYIDGLKARNELLPLVSDGVSRPNATHREILVDGEIQIKRLRFNLF